MLISISDISDSNSQWTYFLVEAPRYGDEDFSLSSEEESDMEKCDLGTF